MRPDVWPSDTCSDWLYERHHLHFLVPRYRGESLLDINEALSTDKVLYRKSSPLRAFNTQVLVVESHPCDRRRAQWLI